LNILTELGLLVKDDRKKKHFWLVPSDYNETKKQVFQDDEGEKETESTELSKEKPIIEKIYTDFIKEMEEYDYVPDPTELSKTLLKKNIKENE
jgi:hypothetical protein